MTTDRDPDPFSGANLESFWAGDEELPLEERIADYLTRTGVRCRAYLTRADWEDEEEPAIVLLLLLFSEEPKRLRADLQAMTLAETPGADRLGVLILSPLQEAELIGVCEPFYGREGWCDD